MVEPTSNDILCGISAVIHPGNRRLREFCMQRKCEYRLRAQNDRDVKRRILLDIYTKCCNENMRFLEKNDDDSWQELPQQQALIKIRSVILTGAKESTSSSFGGSVELTKQAVPEGPKISRSVSVDDKLNDKSPKSVKEADGKRLSDHQKEGSQLFKKQKSDAASEDVLATPVRESSSENQCDNPFEAALSNLLKAHKQESRQKRAKLWAENKELKKQLEMSDETIHVLKAKLREQQKEFEMKAMKLKEYETQNSRFREAAASILFGEKNNLLDAMKDGCGMDAHIV